MAKARAIGLKAPGAIAAAFVFYCLPLTLDAQTPRWKGTITKERDIAVVRNPKEPMFKGASISLKEEFTIPSTGPKDQYLISDIRQVIVDEQGRIYVLDSKMSDIKVFDATGSYVRTIGRKGQGPGELSSPMQISINRTNNELCILQASRRISFFSLDGTFLRNLTTSTIWGLSGRVDSMGNLTLTEGVVDPPETWYAVKKFDSNMKFIAELARTPAPTPIAFDPFLPVARWTIDDNDNIVYGYPREYELQIFNPQNKLVKKIFKDYDPVEVSKEEVEEEKKGLMPEIKPAFSKYHSAFRNLLVDDRGWIYVQTWAMAENGQRPFYDLFDAEGRYLATLTMKERSFVRKGKMYSVEEDEDGNQSIKRYAVIWSLK
jgi:hypothetical protein